MVIRKRHVPRFAASVLTLFCWPAWAQTTQIDASNWGTVVSPVWGTNSGTFRSGPELFAGPNQFGNYFSGVLPNGKIVKPAGQSVQVGMNPLGAALTPDGKYLVTTNASSRSPGASVQNPTNASGYSITVVDTATMQVVSKIAGGKFFVGIQVTGTGPYTVWASGGADHVMYLYTISPTGTIAKGTPASVAIKPILPATAGYVSNYVPDAVFNTADAAGNKPPVPTNFSRTAGAQITFPAGSALSPDGKFLYVACNGDNSVAVIDTKAAKVVRQVPVGYFPYGVAVSGDGQKVLVTNWGITEYKFWNPTYDPETGKLTALAAPEGNQSEGFYVPATDVEGSRPKTSSVSILRAAGGNGAQLMAQGAIYQGKPLDELYQVGDTHPSAAAIVKHAPSGNEILYVTKSNSDSIGLIRLNDNTKLADFDLSPLAITLADGHPVHGAYPNAIVVSPDQRRVYVAEAGINSVAVLDTTDAEKPRLVGRIPTGWYPTALAISANGNSLYVVNAKGVGEDVNPAIDVAAKHRPSGIVSQSGIDSNYIFGTVQKVDLGAITIDNTSVLKNNYAIVPAVNPDVVPAGGKASSKIKHVFFILHENKTFDSMFGAMQAQFGNFASTTYNNVKGEAYENLQYTRVALNTQALAAKFATGANYYSDSEESDAGHQFTTSGTATDYTEKILAVKSGRGLLVTKNMEVENYPEGGYIFNNAARNGVSFKNYGDLTRIAGTDEGSSLPTLMNDPMSGNLGYPQLKEDKASITSPLVNGGDVDSPTKGMGQSYFLATPTLAILGGKNASGEARIDRNYPGWNFNISDQRRALEFINDFDRMVKAGTVPQFVYIYQPNDHTGSAVALNGKVVGTTAAQQVADGDVALGMVVNHIMQSPIYYDAKTGEGSAIFVTWDDAQATVDHIHPHRTPLLVISPYARPGYAATRHYSTASIVKTEELILGLPPNNLGDLLATDLRDMFQSTYNGITADSVPVNRTARVIPSPEGKKVWALVAKLDTSGPDQDSKRLGALGRLAMAADDLYDEAAAKGELKTGKYRSAQSRIYKEAVRVVKAPKPVDADD